MTRVPRLNRTFYGIETKCSPARHGLSLCLNRTFYGIETQNTDAQQDVESRLNRTFYGIETPKKAGSESALAVLIVPFMELKLSLNGGANFIGLS